jgi:hypothetical protein
MGSIRRSLLVAASLLFATAVHAQQAQDGAPVFSLPPSNTQPAPEPNRQGPELDVFREPATPRATPPVVAPTITPPPPVVAQPAPQSRAQSSRPQRTPSAAPAEDSGRSPPAAAQPQPEAPSATREAPAFEPAPPPAANAVEPAPSSPAPAPVVQEEGGSALPWILGVAVALAALAAGFLFVRRRKAALPPEPAVVAEPQPAPPPRPTPVAKPTPPPPTAPTPAPASPAAPEADRPWLDMDLGITQARFSLLGVTVSYSLTLHNRGERPAREVMVRGVLGNGGAQQQALLEGFFAGQDGLPLHSVVAIAPGETQSLSGELRLSPDQIVPVTMGQRSLLIPIAAFDAAYLWGDQDGEAAGHGRTARAFVVGQEQEPPADRLAPLRLDQGPRQYRRPAARAAAELTPA